MGAAAGGGADQATMRTVNRDLLVHLLRSEGPQSRAALAKRTALAKPTISAIVVDLVSEGVIREVGYAEPSPGGGRPPLLYEFDPRSQLVIGLHVGVEETTAVLADGVGAELRRLAAPTPAGDGVAAMQGAARLARRLVAAQGGGGPAVDAIGLAVPGLVAPATGRCILAPNLGWRDLDVVAPLQRVLDVPVHLMNVAQAVAMAENTDGVVGGSELAVLLYEDNGVGAGIVVGDGLFDGAAGLAGEVGHVKLPGATGVCGCGGLGCLETVVSTDAILDRVAAVTGPLGERGHAGLAAVARAEDPAVQEVLREVGRVLGGAVAWVVNLLNPDLVVLAGGFVQAGPSLLAGVREGVAVGALPAVARHVDIELSTLAGDAAIRGATLVGLRRSDRSARLVIGAEGRAT